MDKQYTLTFTVLLPPTAAYEGAGLADLRKKMLGDDKVVHSLCAAVNETLNRHGWHIRRQCVKLEESPRLGDASPDLLAACEAQERYEQYIKEHGHDNSSAWLVLRMDAFDKRQAAIAKARGA